MTKSKLASAIAKKEGKKSQARIGDIREILGIIVELEVETLTSETSPLSILMSEVKKLQAKKAGKK